MIAKGSMVKVVRGRKVPLGTKGVLFWMGRGKFGTRVGIKDAEGKVYWTAYTNIEMDVDAATTVLDKKKAELANAEAVVAKLNREVMDLEKALDTPEKANERWLQMKNQFAQREIEQDQAAEEAKMRDEMAGVYKNWGGQFEAT